MFDGVSQSMIRGIGIAIPLLTSGGEKTGVEKMGDV